MSRRLISTGSPFEKQAGYSRAVAHGPFCFVAGTTGYDYVAMTMPEEVGAQTGNALATIGRALKEAGFDLADVVRATYYIADQSYADRVFAVVGMAFGDIRPAATMLVCNLIRPEMKVEIEVTAYRP
jgi:enamine deaminase RidA (YjgF/YER057c/UK114 family)